MSCSTIYARHALLESHVDETAGDDKAQERPSARFIAVGDSLSLAYIYDVRTRRSRREKASRAVRQRVDLTHSLSLSLGLRVFARAFANPRSLMRRFERLEKARKRCGCWGLNLGVCDSSLYLLKMIFQSWKFLFYFRVLHDIS